MLHERTAHHIKEFLGFGLGVPPVIIKIIGGGDVLGDPLEHYFRCLDHPPLFIAKQTASFQDHLHFVS